MCIYKIYCQCLYVREPNFILIFFCGKIECSNAVCGMCAGTLYSILIFWKCSPFFLLQYSWCSDAKYCGTNTDCQNKILYLLVSYDCGRLAVPAPSVQDFMSRAKSHWLSSVTFIGRSNLCVSLIPDNPLLPDSYFRLSDIIRLSFPDFRVVVELARFKK